MIYVEDGTSAGVRVEGLRGGRSAGGMLSGSGNSWKPHSLQN